MNANRTDNTAQHVDEQDWRAQETALAGASADRRDALLARALHTLPASRPPQGFAEDVARLVAAGGLAKARQPEPEPNLERVLLNALVVVFAVSAVVVVVTQGGQWWAMAGDAIGTGATQWLLAGVACIALSWGLGGVRRLLDAAHAPAT